MDLSQLSHLPDYSLFLLAYAHCGLFGCRSTSEFLPHSTYNVSRTCNVYKRGPGLGIWGLKLGRGFHSQSFQKSHWFSPLSTRYIGRCSSLHNIQRNYSKASIELKSKNMLLYLVALVFAMVGCSYAAVPLYRRFCQATGYGGTVQRREVYFSLAFVIMSDCSFLCFSIEKGFPLCRALKKRLLAMLKMEQ